MGQSVNKVFLLGRIGNDLELKKSKNGSSEFMKISIVTNERRREKVGDKETWRDHSVWHSTIAFGSVARGLMTLAKRGNLKKGTRIHIEGKLDSYSYKDKKTGEDKTNISITVIEASPIF